MTQEDKLLLLKALCEGLPYGVIVVDDNGNKMPLDYEGTIINKKFTEVLSDAIDEYKIKPYLRSMSSMTIEEEGEFCRLFECDSVNVMYGYINWTVGGSCDYDDFDIEFSKLAKVIDWLNAHRFDYRGLIEKGLALEAKKGMYD